MLDTETNELQSFGYPLESKTCVSLVANRVPFFQLVPISILAGSESADVTVQNVKTAFTCLAALLLLCPPITQ